MTRFERVMAVTLFAVPLSGAWLIPREIASYFRDAAERSEARQRQGGPIDSFPFRHEQQKFERITRICEGATVVGWAGAGTWMLWRRRTKPVNRAGAPASDRRARRDRRRAGRGVAR